MSELRSLLDQLAALDLADFHPLDPADEQLREFLPLAQTGINRLSAVLTRAVADGAARQVHRADGMVSMKSWLTGHCRISGREATGLVQAGRRLDVLPRLAAAYAEGSVTPGHVQVIATAVTPARVARAEAAGIDLATTERVLAEAARTLGPEDTAKAVRRWLAGVDPDGTLDEDAALCRVFRMALSSNGRVYLSGHLDAVGGEFVHAGPGAVMNGHRPAGDRRPHAERMGDALVELARRALNSGRLPEVRGQRPQLRVSIDVMALCAQRGAPGVAGGELPFSGPIGPETARRLACDASVIGVYTGPGGLPLDVGRAQRTAPAAIRRGVEVRDGHCVFTGCTAPPAWCDVHHVIHWVHGGPTSCENGALLCERQHTAVHEGGF
ncbi:MAG: endonuclease, partial [Blastococcus sp.]|nr:endonuclease [Blastococcus sp.]